MEQVPGDRGQRNEPVRRTLFRPVVYADIQRIHDGTLEQEEQERREVKVKYISIAHEMIEGKHARGKIVLQVAS